MPHHEISVLVNFFNRLVIDGSVTHCGVVVKSPVLTCQSCVDMLTLKSRQITKRCERMHKSPFKIKISACHQPEDRDLNNLCIGLFEGTGKASKMRDGAELIIHNNHAHDIAIWFSKKNNNYDNDAPALIGGWSSVSNSLNELVLRPGEHTDGKNLTLKPRGKGFNFWVKVNFGPDKSRDDDGGGIATSKEIEVIPP